MCEPVHDEFGSAEDQEDDLENREDDNANVEMDTDEWRRDRSRQYGGGAAVARELGEEPPPLFVPSQEVKPNLALNASSPVAWEFLRQESTGITVHVVMASFCAVSQCSYIDG